MSEHDFEPIRGLPGLLPAGETLLWQGAPDWWAVARRVYHLPVVAGYFGVLLAWRGADAIGGGAAPLSALRTALYTLPLAAGALGVLALLAWLTARTTVYSITSRRVVLRFGIALPKAINIPFGIIETADLKTGADGRGDLAISLVRPNKVAYLQLWPHARPWRLNAPQPTLRGLADPTSVASILASALTGSPVAVTAPVAAPRPALEPALGRRAEPEAA